LDCRSDSDSKNNHYASGDEEFLKFIRLLIKDFNDIILQVEKYIENGNIIRNISFKIEILKIPEYTLEIIKHPIS